MGANTGNMSSVDHKTAYAQSFGNLPDETLYYTGARVGFKAFDGREKLNEIALEGAKNVQKKSYFTTSGGTGTAGVATVPVFVDPIIVDTSRKFTPLVELIPRVTNQGLTADYVRVTAKSFASTFAEGGALSDGSATRERVSKTIKYLQSTGLVTGQAIASVPGYILAGFEPTGAGMAPGDPFSDASTGGALQQEVQLAARHLKELEENLIINGNATTSAISGNANGTEYDGIIQQQSTTNQTDLSGAALEWVDVESSVQEAFVDSGRPNLAVASPGVVTRLRVLMIDTYRFAPTGLVSEIAFGIPSNITIQTSIGPIPVIQSQFLSDTAAARRIYFLDMAWVEMRVLQDMTFERLAKTFDAEKFFLKIYEVLLLRVPEFNSNIIGIA